MLEQLVNAGWVICSRVHHLDGPVELPLCARCTGLYLSFAVTMAVAALGVKRMRHDSDRYRLIMAVLLVAAAPIHALFFPHSVSLYRFATGAATGSGIAILLGSPVWAGILVAHLLSFAAATQNPVILTIYAYATLPALLVVVMIPLSKVIRFIPSSAHSLYRPGAPGAGNEIMVPHGE